MALPFISDLQLFLAILASALGVFLWLGLAAHTHDLRCRAVPLRIHVAGSRGKTSTARLIGAALRTDGRRVLVKTTGTDPLLIHPDGSEHAWRRWGPPSISEQVRFFRIAHRQRADAVVLESMAIEPEYLWASEHYLVRATHTVITNVRPDHQEVVGTHPMAAAHAMSLVIPDSGQLILSEEAVVPPIVARAKKYGAFMTAVATSGLGYDAANRALALAACTSAGLMPDVAKAGFDAAGEDPGTFMIARRTIDGRDLSVASAFSCNDAESLELLWQENQPQEAPILLFNPRNDRPERTRALLGAIARLEPHGQIWLGGYVPRRWIQAAGIAPDRIRHLRTRNARRALSILSANAAPGATIWGIGNYSRLGRDIVALIRQETSLC